MRGYASELGAILLGLGAVVVIAWAVGSVFTAIEQTAAAIGNGIVAWANTAAAIGTTAAPYAAAVAGLGVLAAGLLRWQRTRAGTRLEAARLILDPERRP